MALTTHHEGTVQSGSAQPGSLQPGSAQSGSAQSGSVRPRGGDAASGVLTDVFQRCRAEERAALVGYLPAGYPTIEDSAAAFDIIVDNGCDVVEVGISYSDPMMDGPTIQAATTMALDNGVRTRDIFPLIERIAGGAVPVVMSYWNPILQYGVDAFARDLAQAGGAGIITPDLIPEEAGEWKAAADRYGLDRIFLVAPSTKPERLAMTLEECSGFVYAASIMGVTGARTTVSSQAPELVGRIREHSDIPVGVGLGVKNREQASELASYADAVIVGSALVTAISHGMSNLENLTQELAQGVRSPLRPRNHPNQAED